ncbi:acyltransferase [Pseudoflavonifractor phocaeensis]|uniref:acyltransferase n=1 Tax=Pseudoflavonifractor phocaeensis TaxID=1870988 RepID=UPI001F26C8E8|nr:acyltransferase [Pseudoflavonifractor phocaeensis]MCF2661519.1 N-acetyltransferase [Pseudoflavonifractor phocaeensis]
MEKNYFVHESSYVDEDVEIGEGTKIWHFCHIQKGARIGKRCSLGQNVNISNHVKIGDGCKLQNNVSLYEGVELEDYVFCGPSCVFTNDLTPRSKYPKGSAGYKKTLIREGASIGANATIVCGHTVGRWALIGAGAVVADNVPNHAMMLGVPARIAGYVCECGARMNFENDQAICAACGRTYQKSPNGNVEET